MQPTNLLSCISIGLKNHRLQHNLQQSKNPRLYGKYGEIHEQKVTVLTDYRQL